MIHYWMIPYWMNQVLEYTEASAMTRHLDYDEKGLAIVQTPPYIRYRLHYVDVVQSYIFCVQVSTSSYVKLYAYRYPSARLAPLHDLGYPVIQCLVV